MPVENQKEATLSHDGYQAALQKNRLGL